MCFGFFFIRYLSLHPMLFFQYAHANSIRKSGVTTEEHRSYNEGSATLEMILHECQTLPIMHHYVTCIIRLYPNNKTIMQLS